MLWRGVFDLLLVQRRAEACFWAFDEGDIFIFWVLFIYGVIETEYLAGSHGAAENLKTINPYLHPIVQSHGWWPPLLWKGQMRLIFTEPSIVGNYIAFLLPIFWGGILLVREKKFLYMALASTAVITFLLDCWACGQI